MSKTYDASWENALTVVQAAQPPFIPEGAHAMTVVIDDEELEARKHLRVPAESTTPKPLV